MKPALCHFHGDCPTGALRPGVLVDRQIRAALDFALLAIDPFNPDMLQPASYDLRIGECIGLSGDDRTVAVNRRPSVTLAPQCGARVQSLETLALAPRILGRVGPKTSLVRRGLFVSTGAQIDPGFRGRLFVDVINIGPSPVTIRHDEPFMTIEFHLLSDVPERGFGRPRADDPGCGLLPAELYRKAAGVRDVIRAVADLERDIARRFGLDGGVTAEAADRGGAISAAQVVSIDSLAPSPAGLARTIMASVEPCGDEFLARFPETGIAITGGTPDEAIASLKSLILETYDDLTGCDPASLGARQRARLATLNEFIVADGALPAKG